MYLRLILIFLIVLSAATANAQSFLGGIKAGLSTTQVNGDGYSGFDKLGLTGGLYVRLPYKTEQAFQFEMNYVEKGSRHIPDEYDWNDYTIALKYAEIATLYLYTYKKFRFEAGLALGILIKGEEISYYPVNMIPFNRFDFCGSLGLSYPLSPKLMFNARSSNTFPWTPIRPHASRQTTFFNHGQTNVGIEFTIQYTFNENDD